MIGTDYNSIYNAYFNAQNQAKKTKGAVGDKSKMSKNMEYLAKAKANGAKRTAQTKASSGAADAADAKQHSDKTAKSSGNNAVTQEDIQKLYAKLQGINYGDFDEQDGIRSMANSYLNQMVFSPMSSSNLFVPNLNRGALTAVFNAAYDSRDKIDRIAQNFNLKDAEGEE